MADTPQPPEERADDPTRTRDGGLGDDLSRSDMQLIGKALRSRWTLPDKLPAFVVNRLAILATAKESSNRDALAAAKLLIEIERLNVSAVETEIKARTFEQTEEQLKQLQEQLRRIQQEHQPQKPAKTW